jgi:two-component system response regulator GlrR
MEGLLRRARLVAATDSSVFISGPSGAGKEVLAQAIHKASRRSTGPMIAVNCAAISDALFESELFGHSKGSFTGASREHVGLFLAATGGTLFLDEIADIPLAFQAKMLRAIQEREIRPVGSVESKPIDIRLISASWRDLDEAILEGRFRQDLYYRLNVVALEVPSLAERREDIPLLARHFLAKLAKDGEKTVTGFSQDALDLLFAADWPGNVRQLYNVVEQTYALTTSPIIPLSLVRQAVHDVEENAIIPLTEAKRAFEREYLTKALRAASGNVSRAAMLSGRNRTDFYKLLARHGIQPEHFKKLG